jgi:hypothetical protein
MTALDPREARYSAHLRVSPPGTDEATARLDYEEAARPASAGPGLLRCFKEPLSEQLDDQQLRGLRCRDSWKVFVAGSLPAVCGELLICVENQ